MNWDPETRTYHLPEDSAAGRRAREFGRTSVEYDADGNPDLRPFNHPALGGSPVRIQGFSQNRPSNFRKFRDAARERTGDHQWPSPPRNQLRTAPRNWTWHEDRDRRDGYLVPTEIHDALPHTGGIAVQKELDAST